MFALFPPLTGATGTQAQLARIRRSDNEEVGPSPRCRLGSVSPCPTKCRKLELSSLLPAVSGAIAQDRPQCHVRMLAFRRLVSSFQQCPGICSCESDRCALVDVLTDSLTAKLKSPNASVARSLAAEHVG